MDVLFATHLRRFCWIVWHGDKLTVINNQYNTCFWMLVKSGMTKIQAQKYLKGTQTQEKNELLNNRFGIDYSKLPIMFRQGSSVFWDKAERTTNEMEGVPGIFAKKVVVDYVNIIDKSFWYDHPHILDS